MFWSFAETETETAQATVDEKVRRLEVWDFDAVEEPKTIQTLILHISLQAFRILQY